MIDINPQEECSECGEVALVDMSTNVERRIECSFCDAVYVGNDSMSVGSY
jgi:hypothetical protein